jgi:pyridoxal phosphate enzyme (YggS family)
MEERTTQGLSVTDDGYYETAPQRLKRVRDEIVAAANAANRSPADVELVAVSKTFDIDAVRPVLVAGQRVFGENRVQEAERKWPVLKTEFPEIELHLIGPLQSNKTKDAVALFDAIHTIDREKIARAIAEEASRQRRTLKLFIQVNTGEEPQKAGVMPREARAFVNFCKVELKLPIVGLMCIPPVDEEPAVHFAFLAKLAKEAGLKGLSMGMSGDFEAAIGFGATHIRVGSAIFGQR